MEIKKELSPESMKNHLWKMANEVAEGTIDPQLVKATCNACRSILLVVKEERLVKTFNSSSTNFDKVKF